MNVGCRECPALQLLPAIRWTQQVQIIGAAPINNNPLRFSGVEFLVLTMRAGIRPDLGDNTIRYPDGLRSDPRQDCQKARAWWACWSAATCPGSRSRNPVAAGRTHRDISVSDSPVPADLPRHRTRIRCRRYIDTSNVLRAPPAASRTCSANIASARKWTSRQ